MKFILLKLVRFYQLAISPFMGNHCRFYPTCSRYALVAIERHGALRGGWLAVKRIVRCRPGCAGGVDLVPDVLPKHRCDQC
ncbi:MAG: membrane protein insertion efficiency factor YidD [Formosimonas sp.]